MVSLFDLAGKVARETGASRGIDRAVVEALAEAGARVAVSSGTQAACEEVVATINVVSLIGAMIGADKISAYNMSKAADLQPVRNLAVEPGDSNIRVNAITPGGIRTDFAKPLWEDPAAEFRLCEALPLGRIGEPTGIGGAAFFLASQAAPYITGQSIIIDGEATVIPDRICELGRFGQKSGKGFYLYPDGRTAQVDPEIEQLIVGYSDEIGIERREISDEEIISRCLLAMINEGAKIGLLPLQQVYPRKFLH